MLSLNCSTGRNLIGAVFPLFADNMFEKMTFPGASSFLGGIVSAFILLLKHQGALTN